MSDTLRERVADAICTVDEQNGGPPWGYVKAKGGDFLQSYYDKADAAIALIRAEVLEEAERAVRKALEEHGDPLALEAAIRALKEKSDE